MKFCLLKMLSTDLEQLCYFIKCIFLKMELDCDLTSVETKSSSRGITGVKTRVGEMTHTHPFSSRKSACEPNSHHPWATYQCVIRLMSLELLLIYTSGRRKSLNTHTGLLHLIELLPRFENHGPNSLLIWTQQSYNGVMSIFLSR